MKIAPGRVGLRVINPVSGQPIPADGSFEIPDMTKLSGELQIYWYRAFESGDVVEFIEQPAAKPVPAKTVSKTPAGGADK